MDTMTEEVTAVPSAPSPTAPEGKVKAKQTETPQQVMKRRYIGMTTWLASTDGTFAEKSSDAAADLGSFRRIGKQVSDTTKGIVDAFGDGRFVQAVKLDNDRRLKLAHELSALADPDNQALANTIAKGLEPADIIADMAIAIRPSSAGEQKQGVLSRFASAFGWKSRK